MPTDAGLLARIAEWCAHFAAETAVLFSTGLVILATPGAGVIEALGRKRGGILLLVSAVVLGAAIGSSTVLFVSDFRTWGHRISNLESRMDIHRDSITAPALRRLTAVEGAHEAFERRWEARWQPGGEMDIMREMVHQMYCDQFPARCRPIPQPGSAGGGSSEDGG